MTPDVALLSDIVEKFVGEKATDCRRIGNGHINATFLAVTESGKYTLQRINTGVFSDVEKMMDNIVRVTDHISKKAFTVRPVKSTEGKYFYEDESGVYRLMTYAEGELKERTTSPSDMETVGRGFGLFQYYLRDFHEPLYETIPDFHNTPKRVERLLSSAKRDSDRRGKAESVIEEFLSMKALSDEITSPLFYGKIPVRVTHNDTKINNLVIKDGEPVCAIDLDTVMNGSILYDFGDALRSGGTTAPEDYPRSDAVKADETFYEAFCKGFFSCDLQITENERKLFPISPAVMAYECGIRFLTDYLDYDAYFGAQYSEHNLIRAKNQLALVKDVLKKTDIFGRITDGFFR